MSVRNVTPHADMGGGGGIEFYVDIDWDSPLNVVTDITILDPPERIRVV